MIEDDYYEQAPEPWYRKLTEADLLYEHYTAPVDWNDDNDENNNHTNNKHDTDNTNNNESNCNTNNNNSKQIDSLHADDSFIVEVVNLHFSVTAAELVQHLQYIIGISTPDGGIYRCDLKCKYITNTTISNSISNNNNNSNDTNQNGVDFWRSMGRARVYFASKLQYEKLLVIKNDIGIALLDRQIGLKLINSDIYNYIDISSSTNKHLYHMSKLSVGQLSNPVHESETRNFRSFRSTDTVAIEFSGDTYMSKLLIIYI